MTAIEKRARRVLAETIDEDGSELHLANEDAESCNRGMRIAVNYILFGKDYGNWFRSPQYWELHGAGIDVAKLRRRLKAASRMRFKREKESPNHDTR